MVVEDGRNVRPGLPCDRAAVGPKRFHTSRMAILRGWHDARDFCRNIKRTECGSIDFIGVAGNSSAIGGKRISSARPSGKLTDWLAAPMGGKGSSGEEPRTFAIHRIPGPPPAFIRAPANWFSRRQTRSAINPTSLPEALSRGVPISSPWSWRI